MPSVGRRHHLAGAISLDIRLRRIPFYMFPAALVLAGWAVAEIINALASQ